MGKKFFYTTHKIYAWTSGPSIHTLNDNYDEIESLKQAEELALARKVDSLSDDCVEVTWGVMFTPERS